MLEVHPSWRADVEAAWYALDPAYRESLRSKSLIPDPPRIFNAFKTLPKDGVCYILFGQDPYPRSESATGHAFIDGAVGRLFSPTGLSKAANRATSLRNFIKMALVADGRLDPADTSQAAIAALPKEDLIETIDELRLNFEKNGVLLLNTALVFEDKSASRRHAKAWRPFIRTLLSRLDENTELILFGGIARQILDLPEAQRFARHILEHPYNHTFVTNPEAHRLFGPMRLLEKSDEIF